MNLTFQEKSLWLTFVSLIGAFGYYFVAAMPSRGSADVPPRLVVLFVLAVVWLVILEVVGHVVIAVMDRRAETDERDRLIALKGVRNGAFVLATGVFLALCAALMTTGNFFFTHVLLGFWVLAQLVEVGSRLFLYRRGA